MIGKEHDIELQVAKEIARLHIYVDKRQFFDIATYVLCMMEGEPEYLRAYDLGMLERSVDSIVNSFKKCLNA
jgi:hypothetical protein